MFEDVIPVAAYRFTINGVSLLNYLAEDGMGIATVGCDVLKMQVASESRALLRHEVNVLDAI